MKFAAQPLRPWILSIGFGLFGWLAGVSLTTPSPAPAQLCKAPPLSSSNDVPVDESFVAADASGNITLRVENKPVSWVLEQIWLQSGKSFVQVDSSSQPSERVEIASVSSTQSDEELLTKIQEGDESERYDNLALAQKKKIDLPDEILKTIYETDRSPHIRLLAYSYAMETFSGDSSALRDTLENARSLPDSAIAQDAEQRLNVLARLEIERERAEYFPAQ